MRESTFFISQNDVFQGTKASRKHVRINGKPLNGAAWIPGFNWGIGWGIGFGSEIHAIFDKNWGTTFDFAGPEEAAASGSGLFVPVAGRRLLWTRADRTNTT